MIRYELDCLEKVINEYWPDCKIKMLAGRASVHNEMLTLIAVLNYERALRRGMELNLSLGRYKTCGFGQLNYPGPEGEWDEVKCYHANSGGKLCGDIKCPLD